MKSTLDLQYILRRQYENFKQSSMQYLFLFKKVLVFICPVLLSSCTTITDSLFVQDIKVRGPINQPPIKVTGRDSAQFTISPKIFINSNKNFEGFVEGHTKVNNEGIFQVDTIVNGNGVSYKISHGANRFDFEGKNLHWTIPDYMVGLDLDIALSPKIALSGGFSLSSKDKTNLFGIS
jgi:hypothetical protein